MLIVHVVELDVDAPEHVRAVEGDDVRVRRDGEAAVHAVGAAAAPHQLLVRPRVGLHQQPRPVVLGLVTEQLYMFITK